MGEDVKGLDVSETSKKSVVAVKQLSKNIGLSQALREGGVRRKDIPATYYLERDNGLWYRDT